MAVNQFSDMTPKKFEDSVRTKFILKESSRRPLNPTPEQKELPQIGQDNPEYKSWYAEGFVTKPT
jgi:hypothetical protein